MCCTGTKKLNNCEETAVFRGLAFSMTVTRKRYVENIHKCLAQKLRSYLKNDSVHKKKLLLTQVPHRKIKYLYQHTDSIFIDHFLWIQWTFLISNNSTLLKSQAVIIFFYCHWIKLLWNLLSFKSNPVKKYWQDFLTIFRVFYHWSSL